MSIKRLSDDVAGQLRSSVQITSLNTAICGLLKNSLDAEATKINIYYHYGRGDCTVEDNGLGIATGEFQENGGLAKLHHTSRHPISSDTHGTHGDFLASLAAVSLLRIVSHHAGHTSQSSLTIRNGTELTRGIPCLAEHSLQIFEHGTRVTVRDLFGLLPVRVKHRAAMASEPANVAKNRRQLIWELTAVLLAWPKAVSVSITDTVTKRQVRLKCLTNETEIPRTVTLLTQSGLVESSNSGSWVPVSANSGQIHIRGCISSIPVATRQSQFLCLGLCPLTNELGADVLYDKINKTFANSSFGIIEPDDDSRQKRDKHLNENSWSTSRNRKDVERWPMFYMQIQTSEDLMVDLLKSSLALLPDDFVLAILDMLQAICYGFLKKLHMRPRKTPISKDHFALSTDPKLGRIRNTKSLDPGVPPQVNAGTQSIETPRSPSRFKMTSNPFGSWQRVKVGQATQLANKQDSQQTSYQRKLNSKEPSPLVAADGTLLRRPFIISTETGDAKTILSDESASTAIQTIAKLSEYENRDMTSVLSQTSKVRTTVSKALSSILDTRTQVSNMPRSVPSEWLQKLEASWENPVFETASEPLPRAYRENVPPASDGSIKTRTSCWGASHSADELLFESASSTVSSRLSREVLSEAEVLSQVDNKFILVKLPVQATRAESSQSLDSVLVMIDQHAADERHQLETLMKEYFEEVEKSPWMKPVTEVLKTPLKIELSSKENKMLLRYETYFATWGIIYQRQPLGGPRNDDQASTITVTSLPVGIAERCCREPRVLVEILRKEIWVLHDDGKKPNGPIGGSDASSFGWLARFHGCPQGILELLHSRSCRSAIMFNDVLDMKECEQVVTRLARCALPFQCAHGRPSMAPLLDLGSSLRIGGWDEKATAIDDAKKWRDWAQSRE